MPPAAHGSLRSRSLLRLFDHPSPATDLCQAACLQRLSNNLPPPMDLCQAAAGCGSSIILRRPWIFAKPQQDAALR